MNRLPQVLQNEIWEYVRGDRAYWRKQFQKAADHIEVLGHFTGEFILMGHKVLSRSGLMLKWHVQPYFAEIVIDHINACRAVGAPEDFQDNWRIYIAKWNHYLWYHKHLPRGQNCFQRDCPFGS